MHELALSIKRGGGNVYPEDCCDDAGIAFSSKSCFVEVDLEYHLYDAHSDLPFCREFRR